jgi:predicted Zn-dependent peptidase
MNQRLSLLATLKLALKRLEVAGAQAGPDGNSMDARPALREQIEIWQAVEEGNDDRVMQVLRDTILERKAILVLGWASGQKVRANLQKNGFGRLSQEVSNETLIGLMAQNLDYFEWARPVREIAEKIEQETPSDVVKEVGLDRPEPKDT